MNQNPIPAPPTLQQFKDQFSRDFIYGPGIETVRDVDIQNAINAASSLFNPCLFSTKAIGTPPNLTSEAVICYNNAAAHFLVTSIQGVGGLGKKGRGTNSQGEGVVSSKSVGGVSVSFAWPSVITDSAVLFQFTKTVYGQAYLQVLATKLVGNVSAVLGEVAEGSPPNPGFF